MPGGPCSRSRPARDVVRGHLHQPVHGPGHRRGVVGPHLGPGPGRDLAGRPVRAAARGDVPEAHRHVLRLRFGLVLHALRGRAEHAGGEFVTDRRHGHVRAPAPARDEHGPALALGEGGAAVAVARRAQHGGLRRQEGRLRLDPLDRHAVRVRLLAGCEPAEKQRVDDIRRGIAVVDVEPDRQRVMRVGWHGAHDPAHGAPVHPCFAGSGAQVPSSNAFGVKVRTATLPRTFLAWTLPAGPGCLYHGLRSNPHKEPHT